MKNIVKRALPIPIIIFLIFILYMIGIPINCPFHELTGWYCPGCGLTRMIISFIEGNIYQAFRYNPLLFIFSFLLIPYIIYIYIVQILDLDDKLTRRIPNFVWYSLIIIFILFGILRNIDDFIWMAPTIIK